MSDEDPIHWNQVRMIYGQHNVCCGPNHGLPDVLPVGERRWQAGHCMSLTQIDPEADHRGYLLFCSAHCLCDWHGGVSAKVQDMRAEHPDMPTVVGGSFTLVWIGLFQTTVGQYDTWEELGEQIADYQKRAMESGLI